jgi:hypothetical protein
MIAAALILLLVARTKAQSLSDRPIFKPLGPFTAGTASTPAPAVALQPPAYGPSPASFERAPADSAGDLIEPLAFLLGKYVKYPALGHPVLDELVRNLRMTARGTADEAVDRAANLVRYGDRTKLLILLAGAAFAGWLLARQDYSATPRDITPAE